MEVLMSNSEETKNDPNMISGTIEESINILREAANSDSALRVLDYLNSFLRSKCFFKSISLRSRIVLTYKYIHHSLSHELKDDDRAILDVCCREIELFNSNYNKKYNNLD